MNNYQGMTVNERLFSSGLMDEFDNAVRIKDVKKVVLILKKIDLKDESIIPILKYLKLPVSSVGD